MKSAFAKIVTETKPTSVDPLKKGVSGALLATYRGGLRAVLKPAREKLPNGNMRQRGLPVITQPYREAAFYALAKYLGSDFEALVPETVLTEHDGVVASAQLFLPGAMQLYDLNPHLKTLRGDVSWGDEVKKTALKVPKKFWKKLLALDIIAGSRDRHVHNVGITMQLRDATPTFRLHAWDNACSFGQTFKRYHNVFHKFIFRHYVNFDDVWPAWDRITLEGLTQALAPFQLTTAEVNDAYLRTQFFQDYPYRLPWKVVSDGKDRARDFPDYASYFKPILEQPQHLVALGA